MSTLGRESGVSLDSQTPPLEGAGGRTLQTNFGKN